MWRARGFGLVDVVVGIGLMLLLFVALFGVLKASLSLSALAKAKAAAVELANTQMEYLRGLSYDSLGTIGGIPSGTIAQNATSTVDGISYGVRTFIEYVDDPADGLGASDTNGITTDYKTAKVIVSYTLNGLAKSLALVSNFVPAGIESSTGGGTLSLHILDATGANLGNASVRVVNASTSPTIDFTTFSNASGIALIGGAATSSQYRINVSEPGYSTAQTYARDATNVNPSPGYLTVAKDQTTGATFAIDRLTSLTVSTFSPATTTTFFDTFTSNANIASTTNTVVSGGALTLATGKSSGSAIAIPYNPSPLVSWGNASATLSAPASTTVALHIYDSSGNLLPDTALAGNATGFTVFPVDLSAVSTTTYPGLSLGATLSTSTTTKPSVLDWTLSANRGPVSLPNVSFTLTGAKTIGTTSGGASIYKTIIAATSGSTGVVTLPLEWDTYALSGLSYTLAAGSSLPPYAIAPGTSTSTVLYLAEP